MYGVPRFLMPKGKTLRLQILLLYFKLFNAPSGQFFTIAKELLIEIDAEELKGNDIKLDQHIESLYLYLKAVLERGAKIDENKGRQLLERLRNS